VYLSPPLSGAVNGLAKPFHGFIADFEIRHIEERRHGLLW
jgi:hypothetical protein